MTWFRVSFSYRVKKNTLHSFVYMQCVGGNKAAGDFVLHWLSRILSGVKILEVKSVNKTLAKM